MNVLRGHLRLFYVVILMEYVGINSEEYVRSTPNKFRQNRHLTSVRSSGTPILWNNASEPHLKTTNISSDVRKTSNQYTWPWKTYEEWKLHQEKIENDIDRILKSGKNNFLVSNRTKKPNLKHRRFKFGMNVQKRNKRPDAKRRLHRRRKRVKKQKKQIQTRNELEDHFSTGGAVLSVKYYSTEDGVTAKDGKFETFNGETSSTTKPSVGPGVNECSVNNGGCEGLCVQSKSSYYCHCPEGFRLDASRRKCIDLNDCLSRNGHGPCQGECINEWGSFKCGCDTVPGTQLDADGIRCLPIDRCSETNCSHICINTRSGAFCSCPDGFTLESDWKTCKEVL